MLQIDPEMLNRLAEIEADLHLRRERAEAEGWLGEIEGIDLTLIFLRDKRAEAHRIEQRGPVDVGIPALRRKKGVEK